MLRLFRHIRQRLFLRRPEGYEGHVLSGQVPRYFGYAVGEVVLIVVGILIALQISQWNQTRVNSKIEFQYIERLMTDIERDIELLTGAIELTDMRDGFTNLLIETVTNSDYAVKYPVEFLIALRYACRPSEPPLFSDTFDELRSTGHLSLMNQNLKEMTTEIVIMIPQK